MTVRNKLFLTALSAAFAASGAVATPALAQAAAAAQASFAPGMQVEDTQGGAVGTVVRVDGDHLIVRTDRHEARLPQTSFTAHEGKLLMAMTRDQLNSAIDASLAKAQAQMVAGATVTGSQGSTVGTIEEIDGQFVTLKLSSGSLVRLPRSGVAAGPNGPVIGLSAAELEAQVGGSAPAAAAEGAAEADADAEGDATAE